jgi:hypothetical protein
MAEAVLIDFGPLQMVAPSGSRICRRTSDELQAAFIFDAFGFDEEALRSVHRAEVRLRVTDRDRAVARGSAMPGTLLLHSQSERLRRQWAERDRVVSLIPKDEAVLTPLEAHTIERVDVLLAEAVALRRAPEGREMASLTNRVLANDKLKEARGALLRIERSLEARTNMRWADRVLTEIQGLEAEQGGHSEFISAGGFERDEDGGRRPTNGTPLQLHSRDGILTLVTSKALTHVQAQALLQYRTLYEQTDPERSLRPAPIDPADVRVGGGGEGWAEKRAKLWDARRQIEQKIVDDQPRRALRAVHEVAGKGRTVSSFSKGAARGLNTAALQRAADVVAAHYGLG